MMCSTTPVATLFNLLGRENDKKRQNASASGEKPAFSRICKQK
jgi:hypothetical protein